MKHVIKSIINGVIIGSSMLLPGVSGGSMAIILGVYDKLILAVSDLRKDLKNNLTFLLWYCLGGGIGILLFAKTLLYLTETYEKPMMFLFLGAVCGSFPLLYKKAQLQKKDFKIINLVYVVIGFMLVFLIENLPENLIAFGAELTVSGYLLLFVIGLILSVALVLPGISFSYMLLILGIYKSALHAIETMQIPFLATLCIGVLLGILLTAKILGYVMKKAPAPTFLIIIGFILGTLKDIYPGMPSGIMIIICLATFLTGFLVILQLSKHSDD